MVVGTTHATAAKCCTSPELVTRLLLVRKSWWCRCGKTGQNGLRRQKKRRCSCAMKGHGGGGGEGTGVPTACPVIRKCHAPTGGIAQRISKVSRYAKMERPTIELRCGAAGVAAHEMGWWVEVNNGRTGYPTVTPQRLQIRPPGRPNGDGGG